MRPQYWRNACRKTPWIARLFGRICEPLMAKHSVEKWIASLVATHASLSVSQDIGAAKTTQDTYGQLLLPLFEMSDLQSVSLKTSHDIYDWGLNKSQMTYSQWVTKLRQVCLARRKSVQRTIGNVSSYWPTVLASAGVGASSKEVAAGDPRKRIDVAVQLWRTPVAIDGQGGHQEFQQGKNLQLMLRDQATTLFPCGHQCQTTKESGVKFPHTLNPAFCEWLMGWPIGWTELEPVGTALFHWSRRMRGELLRLGWN